MNKNIIIGIIYFFQISLSYSQVKPVLVIHGGAGTIANLSESEQNQYGQKLKQSLNEGYQVLEEQGSAIEAVITAIKVLEDSPLFNAGKGSKFTQEGKIEMDASIMDGKTLNAGAITGATSIKNPIVAALAVMSNSPHVMLMGEGAEIFAKEQGLTLVNPKYFKTKKRKEQFRMLEDSGKGSKSTSSYKFGTVGAVALDKKGDLAAGTSTGGIWMKKHGRIGDSPIIGAGSYADNNTCAVSSTGAGEYFIRGVIAYDISARMQYKNLSIKKAVQEAIYEKLSSMGGSGGVIALDKNGNIAMEFNTKGMFRGYINQSKELKVTIYKD